MPELKNGRGDLFGNEVIDIDREKWHTMSNSFQTPTEVCRYMVNLLAIDCCVEILEPTAGNGNIVNALRKAEYEVFAPENYWTMERRRFAGVVMNPPFSGKYANMAGSPEHLKKKGMAVGYYILQECMTMADEVVALMPWYTISDSDVRVRRLKEFGIVGLHSLPRKTFDYARIQTVIIHLRRGWKEDAIFKFVG
jgi:hypothetical protein